jgi:hypothetical protein
VKKKTANLPPKLTEVEQDLLSHIQDGYQLETDSLGGNPVLRRFKNNEEIRPLSANGNTIKVRWNGVDSSAPAKVETRSLSCGVRKRKQIRTSAIPLCDWPLRSKQLS